MLQSQAGKEKGAFLPCRPPRHRLDFCRLHNRSSQSLTLPPNGALMGRCQEAGPGGEGTHQKRKKQTNKQRTPKHVKTESCALQQQHECHILAVARGPLAKAHARGPPLG